MRMFSTRTHAFIDYASGFLFIVSPWLFNFADGGAAQWTVVIVGVAILLMSLCTNYEGGVFKAIPMTAHLSMDVVAGIFLAVSPWLFGFANTVKWPHLIFGIMEIGAGLMTSRGTATNHSTLSNT